MSFRQRKMAELAAERQAADGGQPDTPDQHVDDTDAVDTRQPDDADYEGSDEEQPEDDADAGALEDTDDVEPDDNGGPWTAEVEEWREKAQQAEDARASMQKDYSRKTAAVAEQRRALEEAMGQVEQAAQYHAHLAGQELQRFEGVDWNQLAAEPQQYQQAKAAYQQAVQMKQARDQELAQILENNRQQQAAARRRQAQVSQDILRHTVPGWNKDKYVELREFASEFDYTPEEFDANVDARMVRLLDAAKRGADTAKAAPKVLKKVGKKRGKRAQGRNIPVQQRNAKGQFANAEKSLRENPGNRQLTRDYFQKKLALEREQKRR